MSNARGGYFGMELMLLQYTKKEADKLNLVGYVMNSRDGTVVGTVQGPEDKVSEMWVSVVCICEAVNLDNVTSLVAVINFNAGKNRFKL